MAFTLEPNDIPPSTWGFKSKKEALRLSELKNSTLSLPILVSSSVIVLSSFNEIFSLEFNYLSVMHLAPFFASIAFSSFAIYKRKTSKKYLDKLAKELRLAKESEEKAKKLILSTGNNLVEAWNSYTELYKTLIPRAITRLEDASEVKYIGDIKSCAYKVSEINSSFRKSESAIDSYLELIKGENPPPPFSLDYYAESIDFIMSKNDLLLNTIRSSSFVISEELSEKEHHSILKMNDDIKEANLYLTNLKEKFVNLNKGTPLKHLFEVIS